MSILVVNDERGLGGRRVVFVFVCARACWCVCICVGVYLSKKDGQVASSDTFGEEGCVTMCE